MGKKATNANSLTTTRLKVTKKTIIIYNQHREIQYVFSFRYAMANPLVRFLEEFRKLVTLYPDCTLDEIDSAPARD